MQQLFLRYVDLKNQLEIEGGPEENSTLFTEVLKHQDALLKKFGLPLHPAFEKLLWWTATADDIASTIALLDAAARSYLLSTPPTTEKLLAVAVKKRLSHTLVFSEIGIPSHDYTLFLYYQVLLSHKADVKTFMEAIHSSSDPKLLSSIFKLAQKHEPFAGKQYQSLKQRDIPFLDDYLLYARAQKDCADETLHWQ